MGRLAVMFSLFLHLLLHVYYTSSQTLIPLSNFDQFEALSELNRQRASETNVPNMQCFYGISPTLVEEAEKQARTCNASLPTNNRIGYAMFFRPVNEPVSLFIERMITDGQVYDYRTRTCPEPSNQCDPYLQLMWYQGGEMGVAKANCTGVTSPANAYYAVVTTTNRYVRNMFPFFKDRLFRSCTACSDAFSQCNAQRLCCLGPTTVVTTASCGGLPPAGNIASLFRFYLDSRSENALSTDEVVNFKAVSSFGMVAHANDSSCPYLLPIHQLSKNFGSKSTNYYTVNEAEVALFTGMGYTRQQMPIGWALPASGMCGATLPIYTFYGPELHFVQFVGSDTAIQVFQGMWGSYDWAGIPFYIFP